MKINWKYPKPRSGFKGFIDKLSGPGATVAEYWIQFGFAIGMALVMLAYIFVTNLEWNGWQIFVAVYLAFDICGGIATNATSSAKRFWHRKERQHFKNDATFIVAHFYMPLLITLAFPVGWTFFFVVYGYLLLAGFVIAATSLYLRRVVAFMMYCGALLMAMFVFVMPHGLEWFIPFFYLKLLMSHLPIEEPYRPEWEKK